MSFLTIELLKKLPPLYSNEDKGLEAKAVVRFLSLDGACEWYASEGSFVDANGNYDTPNEKVDYLFFGVAKISFVELGYFSLAELESVKNKSGQGLIYRDMDFEPTSLQSLMDDLR